MIEFVRVADRRVRVWRTGKGPPLLCLHGYPDDLSVFGRLAACLHRDFEVLAVDWPGLGESDAVEGVAGPTSLAAWLAELLTVLDLQDVVLLGHDMGGQPALLAGVDPRVRGVVAMNCLAMPDEPVSWELQVLRFGRLYGPILTYGARPVFAQCMRTFFAERPDSELVAKTWSTFREASVRAQLVRMCQAYDAELPGLPARYAASGPVLALWSENDHHFAVAHGAGITRCVPEARLEVLPGARHWAVWERADEVAEHVRRFAAELSPLRG